jgi:hypothetical protein
MCVLVFQSAELFNLGASCIFAATSIVYTFETYDDSPFDKALADAVVIAEFVANLFFLASAVLCLRVWCVENGADAAEDDVDAANLRSESADFFEHSYRAFTDSVELRTRGKQLEPAKHDSRLDSSSADSGVCECCPSACACALVCKSENLKSVDFLESVRRARVPFSIHTFSYSKRFLC